METNFICPHCNKQVEISDAVMHQVRESVKTSEVQKYKDEYEKRLKESNEQMAELLKQMREMKKRESEIEIEMQKKLMAEEEKIRVETTKKAEEAQHLKTLEMQKQLADALKVNEELKHKLQQGSQQNQGEVMELELERLLRQEFPNDVIAPVSKGVRGADLIQEVWDKTGTKSGVILWEIKNAKWSDSWIAKLKEDQRQLKAEIAVVVSENLPSDIKCAVFRDQVWICGREFAIGMAMALRANLIQAHYIKRSVAGKNEKMEVLYNYLSGVEFTQRIEAIVEAFDVMREEIEKEKRWFAAKWTKQEKSLRAVIDHTHGMHGDLAGIMGASLPELKSLGEG
ncbi:MAG: DUF2130 domain-containing protein [Patescibacteria group bacterium]